MRLNIIRAQQRYRQKHRRELRRRAKLRWQLNLEASRKYSREWKREWRQSDPANREIENARRNRHYQRTRQASRAKEKRYRNTPNGRSIRRAIESVRRARKRGATIGSWEAILSVYARAAELRASGLDVVVDHKKPLSRGGKHTARNLQIILRAENMRKHNNEAFVPTRVFT